MNSRGFTLVESLLALAIVGVATAAILTVFVTQVSTNTRNEHRSAAVSAAELELESLRMQDPGSMPTSGSSSPKLVVVGDETYEVVTHYCEQENLCQDATSRYLRIEVKSDGEVVYGAETVFTKLH